MTFSVVLEMRARPFGVMATRQETCFFTRRQFRKKNIKLFGDFFRSVYEIFLEIKPRFLELIGHIFRDFPS